MKHAGCTSLRKMRQGAAQCFEKPAAEPHPATTRHVWWGPPWCDSASQRFQPASQQRWALLGLHHLCTAAAPIAIRCCGRPRRWVGVPTPDSANGRVRKQSWCSDITNFEVQCSQVGESTANSTHLRGAVGGGVAAALHARACRCAQQVGRPRLLRQQRVQRRHPCA